MYTCLNTRAGLKVYGDSLALGLRKNVFDQHALLNAVLTISFRIGSDVPRGFLVAFWDPIATSAVSAPQSLKNQPIQFPLRLFSRTEFLV